MFLFWEVKRIRWIYILIVNIPLHCFMLCSRCVCFSLHKVDHDLLKVVAVLSCRCIKNLVERKPFGTDLTVQPECVSLSPTLSLFSLLFREYERKRARTAEVQMSSSRTMGNKTQFADAFLCSALLLACELQSV